MNTDSHRSPLARTIVLAFLGLAFVGFCLLGVWQVKRLAWKLDLIERVESRIHAEPVAAPRDWNSVSVERDEYRRIRVEGRYLPDRDTRVDALTERGAGDWILTPLHTADGNTVLVNRGFVPDDARAATAPGGDVVVTGLLRISEPHGRILRANMPAQDRWFSRDVQAIAAKRKLRNVAPYFVDAEFDAGAPGACMECWPRGGMTVVSFRNNHLQYALTWFALALLAAYAAWWVAREGRARE
jgi:surfeit locus 1 family protein